MNVKCSNVSADDPRACRGIIRAPRYILPLFLALSLALAPFSVNINNSGVYFEKSEAHAIAPVFAGASAFLAEMATAAGFASVGDFVATVVGVTAATTGMGLATEAGVNYGESASNNLSNLVAAADYPAWSTLTQEQQQSWGSQENYDSAKVNSLMAAFGYGNAYQRYQAGWGSGGGGNFSFTQEEGDNLEALGAIGENWMSGAGNILSNLKGLLKDRNVIDRYVGVSNYQLVDCSELQDWNTSWPHEVYVNYDDVQSVTSSYADESRTTTNSRYTNKYVYWITCKLSDYNQVYPYFIGFYDDTFMYGSFSDQIVNNANVMNNNYGSCYYFSSGTKIGVNFTKVLDSNCKITMGFTEQDAKDLRQFLPAILNLIRPFEAEPTIPFYPSVDPEPATVIYYPIEGINDETTWDELTEEPVEPIVRPDNVYNPDNLSGTQEWRDETSKNVMPLQNIKFDKLFPFCLMTDVKDLTEKIEETITPGEQSDYLKIRVPMAYASDGDGGSVSEEIELDGTPLRDLLVMVRPFNQILLLFLMVFSLVMFWKSILTGD